VVGLIIFAIVAQRRRLDISIIISLKHCGNGFIAGIHERVLNGEEGNIFVQINSGIGYSLLRHPVVTEKLLSLIYLKQVLCQ